MAKFLKAPGRNPEAEVALAELPLEVKGFGPVKEANAAKAKARRAKLLKAIEAGTPVPSRSAAE